MKTDVMKNVIILKNLPSNLIDEAIVIVKDKKKIKDINYSEFIKDGGEKFLALQTDKHQTESYKDIWRKKIWKN